MVWFWLAAFTVMMVIAPDAFGDFWRNCWRILRRR